MEAEAAAPPTPSSAPLWRLEERRARKPASANIFGGVALWQLQKLFQAAGDQDAEQRAQLVWGQGGEAELAQALIGLRARGRRRGLKTHRRDGQMGSRWLRAFHHMRIREASPNSRGVGSNEDSSSSGSSVNNHNDDNEDEDEAEDSDKETLCPVEPCTQTQAKDVSGATVSLPHSQGSIDTPDELRRAGPGLRRGSDSRPERYLHHIIH
ncbi:unnamed protein product [Gadus morhua 'NCC']